MSDSFRNLERSDAAHRKDAVLMAAIGGLECLEHPTRQDMARFSRLFMPLYASASPDIRRTASATLSRLPMVPDDVAEMLINEPITIAAPFIAHYRPLQERALARAVSRNGAPHARAAARRSDLSPQAIASLRSLNDPSVEGLLILRGLIPDPAAAAPAAVAAPAARPASAALTPPRPTVEAPPLDPSEKLRSELRALAVRNPAAKQRNDTPKQPKQTTRLGRPAPAQPLNRPTSTRKPATLSAAQQAEPGHQAAPARPVAASARRGITEIRLAKLADFAKRDQEAWFATALADAMEASFALAERIMMDVSGRQLATALIGLGAPEATIKSALESFFPHLAEPSARYTLASDLIAELDDESCAARLAAWQRADTYTYGGASHVPALADSKPARQAPAPRAAPQDVRTSSTSRKSA